MISPAPTLISRVCRRRERKTGKERKGGSDVEAGKLGRFKQKSVILAQFYSKYILCFLYKQKMLNLLFMLMQKLLKQKRCGSRVAVRR